MAEVTPILLERRFPVGLEVSIATVRDLYHESKAGAWDPNSDIDWGAFDVSQYDAATRAAARLSWSRRAWLLHAGLAETPSVLMRFCLERDREADPKFFLTVRNTEEAWHIECCHRLAELCGGYLETPASTDYAALLNQNFHRQVLHADTLLDGYFAARCMLAEGIELALWQAYLDNAEDTVLRTVLQHCVADKQRHARFGAVYLEQRAPQWGDAEKTRITDYLDAYIRDIELQGYQCAGLAPLAQTSDIVQADAVCAAAGLGALGADAERNIFADALWRLSDQLRRYDLAVTLPDSTEITRLWQ